MACRTCSIFSFVEHQEIVISARSILYLLRYTDMDKVMLVPQKDNGKKTIKEMLNEK